MGEWSDFPRPALLVSRCLGFEPVRYNAQIIRDDFVQRLAALCEPIVVCPEVEIGLGVPRPPIRMLRESDGALAVFQPDTGRDLTVAMRDFANRFLDGLPVVDGVVLKSRSPSCGLDDVKLYRPGDEGPPVGKGAGAFGGRVAERFPFAAVEDEGRLKDGLLRERFLTLLFALARLRAVGAGGERSTLVEFHSRYEHVLLAYDEPGLRELGRIVAAKAEAPWEQTLARYRERFTRSLTHAAPTSAHGDLGRRAYFEPYPRELAG